jgi:hypothetical protein
MKTKRNFIMIIFIMIWAFLGTNCLNAQEQKTSSKEDLHLEADDQSMVFKFEPDLHSKNEQRKAEIARVLKIIDTLDISDRKRIKLVKDLYKNVESRRLKKALLVADKFDDVED